MHNERTCQACGNKLAIVDEYIKTHYDESGGIESVEPEYVYGCLTKDCEEEHFPEPEPIEPDESFWIERRKRLAEEYDEEFDLPF